jgi:hypothetical protein
MHFDSIESMGNIQIRNVPEEVHRRLKGQAALEGQSLNEFLLERLSEQAMLPSWGELAERIKRRGEPYTGSSTAAIIREGRERRTEQLVQAVTRKQRDRQ